MTGISSTQPATSGTASLSKRSRRKRPTPRLRSEAAADQPASRKSSGMCQIAMNPHTMKKKTLDLGIAHVKEGRGVEDHPDVEEEEQVAGEDTQCVEVGAAFAGAGHVQVSVTGGNQAGPSRARAMKLTTLFSTTGSLTR